MCIHHMPRTVLEKMELVAEEVQTLVQGTAPAFDHCEHDIFPS